MAPILRILNDTLVFMSTCVSTCMYMKSCNQLWLIGHSRSDKQSRHIYYVKVTKYSNLKSYRYHHTWNSIWSRDNCFNMSQFSFSLSFSISVHVLSQPNMAYTMFRTLINHLFRECVQVVFCSQLSQQLCKNVNTRG